MMRLFFRYLFLAAALLLLVSCQDSEPVKKITAEELGGYVIVRPDEGSAGDIAAAVKLYEKLAAALSNPPTMGTDWVKKTEEIPADAVEILVGATNRPVSGTAASGLLCMDYSITLNGSRIVIVGGSESALSQAVDALLERLDKDGNLSIPENGIHFSGEYPLKALTLNGLPIGEYGLSGDTPLTDTVRNAIGSACGVMLSEAGENQPAIRLDMTDHLLDNEAAAVYRSGSDILVSGTNASGLQLACGTLLDCLLSGENDITVEHIGADSFIDANSLKALADKAETKIVPSGKKLGSADSNAIVFWSNFIVRPGETLQLMGGNFESGSVVNLRTFGGNDTIKIEPLLVDENLIHAVLPEDLGMAVYEVTVSNSRGDSEPFLVNAPDAWWQLGDGGDHAYPGGWVKIFGSALSFGNASAKLIDAGGVETALKLTAQNQNCLTAEIPAEIAEGEYTISVSNGLAEIYDKSLWLTIESPAEIPELVITLSPAEDETADRIDDFREAFNRLKENNGGTIFLDEGVYYISESLKLPANCRMTCAERDSAMIRLDNGDKPLLMLADGSSVENLYLLHTGDLASNSIYVTGEDVAMRNITLMANPYLSENVSEDFAFSYEFVKAENQKNLIIEGCIMKGAAHHGLDLIGCEWVLLKNNELYSYGETIRSRGTVRACIENNFVSSLNLYGSGSIPIQNASSTIFFNYVAGNTIEHVYCNDMEAITYDDHMSGYIGGVISASGSEVTLESEPFIATETVKHSSWSKSVFESMLNRFNGRDDEWHGATVYIVSGRGAGQHRNLMTVDGQKITVDRPWDIAPDETSFITIGAFNGYHIFDGNLIKDAGVGIQTYPPNTDTIVVNNILVRAGGINFMSRFAQTKDATVCEINWRSLAEGNVFEEGTSGVIIGGSNDDGIWFTKYCTMGITVKNNTLKNGGVSVCQSGANGVVIEGNISTNPISSSGLRLSLDTDVRIPTVNLIARRNIEGLYVHTAASGNAVFCASGTVDSTSIQYALDQVAAAGGGTVYLTDAMYMLDAPLKVPSGVTLKGLSEGLVHMHFYSEKEYSAIITCEDGSAISDISLLYAGRCESVISVRGGCSIERLVLRASPYLKTHVVSDEGLDESAMIDITGGNVTISGCDIFGYGYTIRADGCDSLRVADSMFATSNNAVLAKNSKNVTVENVIAIGNSMCDETTDGTQFWRMDADCGLVFDSCDSVTISSCDIANLFGGERAAVSAHNVDQLSASGNKITDAAVVFILNDVDNAAVSDTVLVRTDAERIDQ